MLQSVRAIRAAGIPVMGHLGYTPQSVHLFGGHRSQGRTLEAARRLYQDALALQEAGVFALVLELVPHKLATWLTRRLEVPTIGIGSGPGCDGQVLVTQDLLGLFPGFNPRHVRKYQDLYGLCSEAVRQYVHDVESGAFPTEGHSFSLDEAVLEALEGDDPLPLACGSAKEAHRDGAGSVHQGDDPLGDRPEAVHPEEV